MPREEFLAVGVGSCLTADDFVRSAAALQRDAPHSPTYTFLCSQDLLEVILRRRAEKGPAADVRFGAAMTSMREVAGGVEAVVSAEGREILVRCRYLVAADGSRSGVRDRLGIKAEGPPVLGHMISIMFEADLGFLPPERRAALSFLRDPPCAVEAVDHGRRWMVQTGYEPEEGGSPADFTEEVCLAAVRAAVGVPDLPVEHPRRAALAAAGQGRRRLPVRPGLPGRGRRARGHPAGRFRHELWHSGRPQPRLEAGRRPARRGRAGAAGHLHRRAPADRRPDRGREPDQRADHLPDDGGAAVHARGRRPAGGPAQLRRAGARLRVRLRRGDPGRHPGPRPRRPLPRLRPVRPPRPPRPARVADGPGRSACPPWTCSAPASPC